MSIYSHPRPPDPAISELDRGGEKPSGQKPPLGKTAHHSNSVAAATAAVLLSCLSAFN